MNVVTLILAAIVVSVLGYRFYAKFLALAVFAPIRELDSHDDQGERRQSTKDFVVVFLHHAAVICGGTTIIGAAIAAAWGWAPAFLWIITGSVVAAGTFMIGNLWIAREIRVSSAGEIVSSILGMRAAIIFYALSLLLFSLLCAILAVLIGEVLAAYPEASWAFLLQLPIAVLVAGYLHRSIGAAAAVGLVIICILLIFGLRVPLAVEGYFDFLIGDQSLSVLGGEFVWTVVALLLAFFTVYVASPQIGRARGYLCGLMLLIALGVAMAGMLVAHPTLVAPAYNAQESIPAPIPLLFLAVTGGALAGFHALVTNTTGVVRLKSKQANIVGYGGALVDGLLALTALVIATAGFVDTTEWELAYPGWPDTVTLQRWLMQYIDGFARFAAAFGLSVELSATFAAFVVTSLALSTLEAGLRAQRAIIQEIGKGLSWQPLLRSRGQILPVLLTVTLLAIYLAQGHNGLPVWLLLGGLNQIVAGAMLLVLLITLAHLNRPWAMVAAPLILILIVSLWGLVVSLVQWWIKAMWLPFGLGVAVLILGSWLLIEGGYSIYHHLYGRTPTPTN
ncbi:MAG: hypothetical protein OEU36_14050 [Gammaproteobacteria bacterium]|nr:hypothetical protein [Gammaproteobacteria bacterium]